MFPDDTKLLNMISRLRAAADKLRFCYRVASDTASFLRIMVETKKSRREHKGHSLVPELYNFRFHGNKREVYLRTWAGDIDIFYEVFWKKVYAGLQLQAGDIRTVVDLGANVGLASLFFSQAFPDACVYSVEPDPENFQCLQANLHPEIARDWLIPLHAGIAAEDGTAYIEKKEKAYNISISTTAKNSDIAVRIMSMNTLVREQHLTSIDFLKIDIEGWEDQLLAGHTEWLQIVRHIIMECHSPAIQQRCEAVLHAHGFRTETTEHQLVRAWK